MNNETMRELDNGMWAEMNPSKCPCNGRGFLLSDYDTSHRCPIHGKGALCMEDTEHMTDAEIETATKAEGARRLAMMRGIFLALANEALDLLGSKAAVMKAVRLVRKGTTPKDYVDAVDMVVSEARYEAEEASAKARGFSCGLEARMEDEAMWERKEAGLDY